MSKLLKIEDMYDFIIRNDGYDSRCLQAFDEVLERAQRQGKPIAYVQNWFLGMYPTYLNTLYAA